MFSTRRRTLAGPLARTCDFHEISPSRNDRDYLDLALIIRSRNIAPPRGERTRNPLSIPASPPPPRLHPGRFTIEGAEPRRAGQNFISRRHIRYPRGVVATLPANLKNVRHLDGSRRAPSSSPARRKAGSKGMYGRGAGAARWKRNRIASRRHLSQPRPSSTASLRHARGCNRLRHCRNSSSRGYPASGVADFLLAAALFRSCLVCKREISSRELREGGTRMYFLTLTITDVLRSACYLSILINHLAPRIRAGNFIKSKLQFEHENNI